MVFDGDREENNVGEMASIKEMLLAVQASNIALAAIIASMPETVNLDPEEVCNTCSVMSEMDAHTEMVTGEFARSILAVAKEIRNMEEESKSI